MDITFITMHDLEPGATVLYASDSVTDVLGYQPQDIVGKTSFDYFHPDDFAAAEAVRSRSLNQDKAAVLKYLRLRRRDGTFVTCECVFTVVYDVLVACTSLYRYSTSMQQRARDAPAIRQAFAASELDPRYHMLQHLSHKFTAAAPGRNEPRAAVILNRFTRTLTILYATNSLNEILGFPPNEAQGRSFFECIEQDCLQDAVDALERAKENDSIAYLRFRWRDPRLAEGRERPNAYAGAPDYLPDGPVEDVEEAAQMERGDTSSDLDDDRSTTTSTPQSSISSGMGQMRSREPIEVEAVISCTSDGLVVVLRRARATPPISARAPVSRPTFASPWAHAPLVPQVGAPTGAGGPTNFEFMESIRQVAVFAWSLRSINENVVQYAKGNAPDTMDRVGGFEDPARAAQRYSFQQKERLVRERGGHPNYNQGYYVGTGATRGYGY